MSVATAVRCVVCLAVLFAAGQAAAKPPAGAVTPQGHTADSLDVVRANLVAGRALLLDVREPSEWNAGHLAIAKPLPLSILRAKDGDATFARFLRNNISDEMIVYLHCKSGGRCLAAAPKLRALGYEVRAIKAGYTQLKSQGFSEIEIPKPSAAAE